MAHAKRRTTNGRTGQTTFTRFRANFIPALHASLFAHAFINIVGVPFIILIILNVLCELCNLHGQRNNKLAVYITVNKIFRCKLKPHTERGSIIDSYYRMPDVANRLMVHMFFLQNTITCC